VASLDHQDLLFERTKNHWPTLKDALCAYAFAKAFHYDDLRASAKLALLESAEHPINLEDFLASINLGSLGASIDTQLIVSEIYNPRSLGTNLDLISRHSLQALRLLTHVHDARVGRQVFKRRYLSKIREHPHNGVDEYLGSDLWDELEDYVTGPGLAGAYDRISNVFNAAKECSRCLLDLHTEVRALETYFNSLAEKHDAKW
jgi:hypothetical protein